MEPAKIDWKSTESRFIRDDLYEDINAPKWVDLSAPQDHSRCNDDEAWFCRPDCRHPKAAEDFLQESSLHPQVKLLRSVSNFSRLHLGERTHNSIKNHHRDAELKRRGGIPLSSSSSSSSPLHSPKSKPMAKKKFREDLENQNPNLSSPAPTVLVTGSKSAKEKIKSSAEKRVEKKHIKPSPPPAQRPLRSTLSARNLFSGKDILSQISEFCSEIKKLATVRRERPDSSLPEEDQVLETSKEIEKDPLLHTEEVEKSNKKQGRELDHTHRWKNDGLDRIRESAASKKGEEKLRPLQEVRSCPPTPQRFPSPLSRQKHTKFTNPLKQSKTITPGRAGILKKMEQNTEEDEGNRMKISTEGKSSNVFWFFKPCTYLGV